MNENQFAKPRLTVLMPVYNVEKYLREAIDSILNQTFADFELLIMDDCSTDSSADIIASYNDSRIRYVRNERNLGLAENLNRGIELAQTEYVSRMDGDDISINTTLEKQLKFLDSHPEIGICGAGFRFFGTKSSTVYYPEYHEDSKVGMFFGCTVILPMFRLSVFKENNLRYKTSAFPAEDYRMWAEAFRVTKVYNFQEVMFNYRMHSEQISTEKRQIQIEKSNEVRLFMLDWLSPDFTDDEKLFFIKKFVPAKISNKKEMDEIVSFADTILKHNAKYKQFDEHALKKRFKIHFSNSTYYYLLDEFFTKRYSIAGFVRFLFTGLGKYLQPRLFSKVFVKSVLMKRR